MTSLTLRRIGWIGASLGLTSVLVGCNDMQSSAPTGDVGGSTTGSSTAQNDLNTVNGLNSANGLNSLDGLAAGAGLMTDANGRKTVSYLVRCALATGDTLVKQDQNNVNYTFK